MVNTDDTLGKRVYRSVFVLIFLALVVLWVWNPIAARLSLPLLDVGPYLPGLLIVGIVLVIASDIAGPYR